MGLRWRPLLPDESFDCHGVYSGSALAEDGRIRVLYTGNVKLSDADGTYDYVNTGRRADTVYVESTDGQAFGAKRVVLTSEDYPEDLTCHVRDPKVWRDVDGRYHMVLGARRRVDGPHVESRFCAMHGEGAGRDVGEILVYGSADMLSWELENRVSTPERFGFMWECPSYIELDAKGGAPAKWLSFSPQGLEAVVGTAAMCMQRATCPLRVTLRLARTLMIWASSACGTQVLTSMRRRSSRPRTVAIF